MGLTYKRGTTITYYCSFLTLDNKEPISIVDPKITIRHVDATNTLITDVNEADLVLAVENTYYYRWTISSDINLGNYTIECQCISDGEYIEYNKTVQVED